MRAFINHGLMAMSYNDVKRRVLTKLNKQELGSGRRADDVEARRLIIWFCRQRGMPVQYIAERLGIHHTSVVYHYYRTVELREIYPQWRQLTDKL